MSEFKTVYLIVRPGSKFVWDWSDSRIEAQKLAEKFAAAVRQATIIVRDGKLIIPEVYA